MRIVSGAAVFSTAFFTLLSGCSSTYEYEPADAGMVSENHDAGMMSQNHDAGGPQLGCAQSTTCGFVRTRFGSGTNNTSCASCVNAAQRACTNAGIQSPLCMPSCDATATNSGCRRIDTWFPCVSPYGVMLSASRCFPSADYVNVNGPTQLDCDCR